MSNTNLAYFRKFLGASVDPAMPVVTMNSTICRDDLLFELELDAVKKR